MITISLLLHILLRDPELILVKFTLYFLSEDEIIIGSIILFNSESTVNC